MPSLRIMTYNVRYFSHVTRGLASTARAMSGIARAIAALEPLPDIICLQEVETASLRANVAHRRAAPDDTQLSRLMALLHAAIAAAGKSDAYAAYYFPAHAYRLRSLNLYTTGLAILAHQDFSVAHHNAGEPYDITHRRLRAIRGWKQTRISAHLRFQHKSGDTVDIFNTHLSLPASFTRKFWLGRERMGWGDNQLEEAKNLARFIDAEKASDRFVVVGDFNALPDSPVYRYLAEEVGLRDGFRRLVSVDERKWPTAGFLNLRMHLDHLFAGPEIEWVDLDGSRPFGERSSSFHGLSDHVPLIARCRVNGAAATEIAQ